MIGQSISHYRVLAKITADSAGILYKAADAQTGRPVTLRALDPAVSTDPQRRERIIRDAMTASGLEHPNLARTQEWLQEGGAEFAVMEAAEGESLQEFLDRERPNRRNLLRFAGQLEAGLAAAHGAGLVHGPLNPGAIFITPTSDIKFFDFGCGALEAPPESDNERRARFGEAAGYVSPEQIEGRRPDTRSDIFSYGALVYHLTTGRLPFQGVTLSETWRAIVSSRPTPIRKLTSRAPAGMSKLIAHCLKKDPRRRPGSINEARPLIEKMADAYRRNPEFTSSFLSRHGERVAKLLGAGLALAAMVAVGVSWWRTHAHKEAVLGGRLLKITYDSGLDTDPAFSADGSQIAYAADRNNSGNLDIWTQSATGGVPRRISSDPADDVEPAFSPDGLTITFRSERDGGGVYLVPSIGGEARLIAREGRGPRYSPDGRWITYWTGPPGLAPKASGAYKVFVISSGGGEPRQIQPGFASCKNPIWAPDSKRILFLGRPDATLADPDAVDWWVAPIDGSAPVDTGACQLFRHKGVLAPFQSAIPGDWKEDHIFYSIPRTEGSNVWRAEISPAWTVENAPVKVTNGKGIEILPVAASGLVAFSNQVFNSDVWSIPVAANEGRITGSLQRRTSDPANDVSPSLSDDGSKLVFQSNRTGHYNVMLLDLKSGKVAPLPASPDDQFWPIVSPDGSKVAWSEPRINRYEQLYRRLGGSSEALCEDCGLAVSGWSRDGSKVLVDSATTDHSRIRVSLVTLANARRTPVVEDAAAHLRQARFSPDDRWIVFRATADGGATRLYIAPVHEQGPAPAREWESLTDGNGWESSPQWSPDGMLIYYLATRDGFHCVWAQRLDASHKPAGAPFAVLHLHSFRLSPATLPFNSMDLWVGRNQIVLSLGELTGNIWTAKIAN